MTILQAGVIGWPLTHTKSPLIHGHWFEKYGIAGTYEAIPVAPEDLKDRVKQLVDAGYRGFNVTVPHKQAIMEMMDFVHADAERIGAVNTVIINAAGKMAGRNTDGFGFRENLKRNALDFDFKAQPAIVLGAGGAARAVVYALAKMGVPEIRIVNRTLARANALAAVFPGCSAHEWDALPALMPDAALVVNTTSLGMSGQPALEIDLAPLPDNALVHDIVYIPLETDLLKAAKTRGLKTVTGIGMLLHQARPAFEAWFGVMPDVDATLEASVLA